MSTSTEDANGALFFMGLALGLSIMLFIGMYLSELSYKTGQVDAVTGNMKFERVMQSDSTVIWEKKK
jgi:hypothetical protein